jgi:hypothetical protein
LDERSGQNKTPSDVLGGAAYDFLTEFWLGMARPRIPRAEDFSELFEPYVQFIQAEAEEKAIGSSMSKQAADEGRKLMLWDMLREARSRKEAAMHRIEEERQKRRFQHPQLPPDRA